MLHDLRRFSIIIKSVLALVLALNALGWAAHVDVPVPVDGAQTGAMSIAGICVGVMDEAPDDGGAADIVGNHCGHANAHFDGLVRYADAVVPAPAAYIAVRYASRYARLSSPPLLDPPIA